MRLLALVLLLASWAVASQAQPSPVGSGGLNTLGSAVAVSAAGTNQGTATALTANVSVITSITSGQGVRLNGSSPLQTVINSSSTVPAFVYPNSGATITGGGTTLGLNAPFTVPVGSSVAFSCSGSTLCYASFPAPTNTINVKAWGALGDTRSYTSGVMTSGSPTLTDTTATPFLPTDCAVGGTGCTGTVNKTITVDGAGTAGAPLSATIIGYTSSSIVTLSANASVTVPYFYVADNFFAVAPPSVATAQSGAGSYAPGNTITLTGGTATTQGVLTVTTTTLVSATANATGSGGTNGACILTGTTGASATGPGLFQINATISSNHITAIGAIVRAGAYTTNPTSLTAEPVTSNCGLTGATLTLKLGVLTAHVSTLGRYSVFPTSPVAQGSTSGSGTGVTFTIGSSTTGSYSYGTDDSVAIFAAMTYALGLNNGQRPMVYFPGGSYYMKGTSTPLITSPLTIQGDGPGVTSFQIDPAYSGDLFSFSEVWGRANFIDGMGATESNANAVIGSFSVFGNVHATGVQNAVSFYDRADYAFVHDIQVDWLHGEALQIGVAKNQNQAYMRESEVRNIRAQFCGTSTLPCINIDTQNTSGIFGDGTNEVRFYSINLFSAQSAAMWIHNTNNTFAATRLLEFHGLRIEQSNNGDNIDFGLSTDTGLTQDVDTFGFESYSPGGGFWGLDFPNNAAGGAFAVDFYGMKFGGFLSGTGGINVAAGAQLHFYLTDMNYTVGSAGGYGIQTASSVTVPFSIVVDFGSSEAALNRNIGTVGVVKSPTWQNMP